MLLGKIKKKFVILLKRILIKVGRFPKSINIRGIKYHDAYLSNVFKSAWLNGEASVEPEMYKLFDLFEYDTFLDCGANVGVFSLYIAKFKGWNVVAYEAFIKNYLYLQNLIKNNEVNIDIKNIALSNENGITTLNVPTNNWHSFLSDKASLIDVNEKNDGRDYSALTFDNYDVEMCNFGEIVKDLSSDKKYLIKMDIEGSELSCLQSIADLASLDNVDFIIEMLMGDDNKNEIFSLLSGSGFDAYLITGCGLVLEDRPLTLPKPGGHYSTVWKNHFFTKRSRSDVKTRSKEIFGNFI